MIIENRCVRCGFPDAIGIFDAQPLRLALQNWKSQLALKTRFLLLIVKLISDYYALYVEDIPAGAKRV